MPTPRGLGEDQTLNNLGEEGLAGPDLVGKAVEAALSPLHSAHISSLSQPYDLTERFTRHSPHCEID
ncbi:hypothetical protein SUGI_0986860 [Cryptomeria japonica]|nr:hypothetical protein SUGI_0986860 [Cryptomeria japonica]